MGGQSIGKKIWHKTVSIGKKLGKVALGAGALLVGGAYAMGKKEMSDSKAETDAIRQRALADEERAAADYEAQQPKIPDAPLPPPLQPAGGGGFFKVVKKKDKNPHAIDPTTGNIVLKKDEVAMGFAAGPEQDPMDVAYGAAMEGKEAAGKFEKGKKKGGLVRKMKFW